MQSIRIQILQNTLYKEYKNIINKSKTTFMLGHPGGGYNGYVKSINGVRKIFKWDGTFMGNGN